MKNKKILIPLLVLVALISLLLSQVSVHAGNNASKQFDNPPPFLPTAAPPAPDCVVNNGALVEINNPPVRFIKDCKTTFVFTSPITTTTSVGRNQFAYLAGNGELHAGASYTGTGTVTINGKNIQKGVFYSSIRSVPLAGLSYKCVLRAEVLRWASLGQPLKSMDVLVRDEQNQIIAFSTDKPMEKFTECDSRLNMPFLAR